MLLTGASTVIHTLIALQTAQRASTPATSSLSTFLLVLGKTPFSSVDFYKESIRALMPARRQQDRFGMVVPGAMRAFPSNSPPTLFIPPARGSSRAVARHLSRILCSWVPIIAA